MPRSNDAAAMPLGDQDLPSPRQTRYGLFLFTVYLVLYGGFVLLSAFAPSFMETDFVAGINLAVCYGIGLILAALALALVYAWLCRASRPARGEEEGR